MAKPDGILIHWEIGQHRSLELAERRLKQLQRLYPEPRFEVVITSRRNAQGQFSKRGHSFLFEVYDLEAEEEELEFTGAFDSP